MSNDNLLRNTVVVLAVTATLYFAAFYGIEHWRARNGPWETAFATDAEGHPCLVVSQPRLKLDRVTIRFADETVPATNPSQVIRFDRPMTTVPWGTVVYQDPTSLPGVVTLQLFGHEIELLPRVLLLNRREIPWQNQSLHQLQAADKLPPDQLLRRNYRREGQ